MLNPRVVNFKPAPVNVTYKTGNILSDQSVVQVLSNHYYNFGVSLILPDSMSIPQNIKDILTVDAEYYKLMSVPLHLLISQDFIDYFIKAGEVSGFSLDRWLNIDNCIAITPCGNLVLNIDSKTYQELGLIKGPAIDVKKMKNSFFVVINLKTNCFRTGHKNYEKAYKNLIQHSSLTFDLLIAWDPTDSKICPSSIAKYFARHSIVVKECSTQESKRISYNVNFPLLTVDQEDLFEWFGAFLFDIRGSKQSESEDFMSFDDPEPNEEIGQVVLMNWTGLFTRKRMLIFFDKIKSLAVTLNEVPWVGFGVLGYLDTPVAWRLRPHAFRTSGENDYTILLNHEGQFSMCKNTETCSVR